MARISRKAALTLLSTLAAALGVDATETRVEQGKGTGYRATKGAKKATPTPKGAKKGGKKSRVRQGELGNERLGFTVGDDCPFCGNAFKATVEAETRDGNERTRATFKGCKHTVNVYEN